MELCFLRRKKCRGATGQKLQLLINSPYKYSGELIISPFAVKNNDCVLT